MEKSKLEILIEHFVLKELNIISESKQQIVNLGYPDLIASMLFDKFGKHAFVISKWLREYDGRLSQEDDGKHSKHWWNNANNYARRGELSLSDMLKVYEAAKSDNREKYKKELIDALPDYYADDDDEFYLDLGEVEKEWKKEIEEKLFDNMFFNSVFMKNVINGKINPNEYKKLSFDEAKKKYDEKRVFADQEPLKSYEDGYKWINVGPRCELVGKKMDNCGSTGVMSRDPDKTMITLFDKENNPHVVVTYSPNENRISGDEGRGSSAVKSKYHDYVLDLAKFLGAKFDYTRTKSNLLKMKAIFGEKLKDIKLLDFKSDNKWPREEFYELELSDGKKYYSNGYFLADKKSTDEIVKKIKKRKVDILTKVFRKQINVPLTGFQDA
jgi:hypothetical protein